MTATFKTLLALLFVLAQGTGAALADQAPAALPEMAVQAAETAAQAPVKETLAWQRVGSPLLEA